MSPWKWSGRSGMIRWVLLTFVCFVPDHQLASRCQFTARFKNFSYRGDTSINSVGQHYENDEITGKDIAEDWFKCRDILHIITRGVCISEKYTAKRTVISSYWMITPSKQESQLVIMPPGRIEDNSSVFFSLTVKLWLHIITCAENNTGIKVSVKPESVKNQSNLFFRSSSRSTSTRKSMLPHRIWSFRTWWLMVSMCCRSVSNRKYMHRQGESCEETLF